MIKIPLADRLFKDRFSGWTQHCLNAAAATAISVGLSFTGVFQLMEWAFFDQVLRSRPIEPPDPNIVIVTFDEFDLDNIGAWPIPDDILATILARIIEYQPKVVGLDVYRNLPVGNSGYDALVKTFQSNENLYGVSRQVNGQALGGAPALEEFDRIRLADLILDIDSKVRRALLSVRLQNGEIKLSLGTQLALEFLEGRGIEADPLPNKDIQLGETRLVPFQGSEGGYINAERGGFQVLLNYRGTEADFHTVSVTDILEGRLPQELIRDRIVIIGTTASTLNDFFQTPYNSALSNETSAPMPGVIIHANITSQLVSAALGERPLLRTVPDYMEWLWVLWWASLGTTGTSFVLTWLQKSNRRNQDKLGILVSFMTLEVIVLAIATGLLISSSLWIPVIPASLGLGCSVLFSLLLSNRQLHSLATLDELTQVANRRSFDQGLAQAIANPNVDVALILCDIDNFKLYNDTYGHQAGDDCLRKVARKMREVVRQQDIVARYGGEEFAIILKGAPPELAEEIAERICEQTYALNIPHTKSEPAQVVTISCGVSLRAQQQHAITPTQLIQMADQALYLSKKQGRNQATIFKKIPKKLPD